MSSILEQNKNATLRSTDRVSDAYMSKKLEEHEKIKDNIIDGLQKSLQSQEEEIK
jgi:hypothetical protein